MDNMAPKRTKAQLFLLGAVSALVIVPPAFLWVITHPRAFMVAVGIVVVGIVGWIMSDADDPT